ncbi:hypothetical protein [Alicyclobacillus sp.]|uniref:hypothetical protein n=1 Tax=Alicyclobacillus sp. TaxID=61169 RepID=UPI0025C33050|nr:hypothetical protein [Alicyclobacillus sp.]MCL6515946.1 hypothetical protein [Alicyclobacillus sp.]
MPATLLVVIALALIVLSAWVWMNILLVRRHRERRAEAGDGAERAAERGKSEPDTALDAAGRPGVPSKGRTVAREGTFPAPDAASAPPVPSEDAAVPRPAEAGETRTRRPDVEIVEAGDASARRRVFDAPKWPFVLNGVSVPAFTTNPWLECFERLTEDARVLGWIAFQGETMGASDREYDPAFLDVLRTYRRTVERVRKEVGLSQVVETTITGEEGKVWFLTGVDDTWFALFVERSTDVGELSRRLLAAVTEPEPQA